LPLSFELKLKVSLVPERTEGVIISKGELPMSDDWARRAFEKVQERETQRKQKEELELQRRKQLLAKAPLMWQELVEAIQIKADELNKLFDKKQEYLKVNSSNSILRVDSPDGNLSLEFNPDVPVVTFRYNRSGQRGESDQLSFAADQGEVRWVGHFSNESTTGLAEGLLNLIV